MCLFGRITSRLELCLYAHWLSAYENMAEQPATHRIALQ